MLGIQKLNLFDYFTKLCVFHKIIFSKLMTKTEVTFVINAPGSLSDLIVDVEASDSDP
jgi:hypothetical protein